MTRANNLVSVSTLEEKADVLDARPDLCEPIRSAARGERCVVTSLEPVLVVVPALNEARHIQQVIESLWVGLAPDRDVLMVVADGGSTDGTQALVRDMVERVGTGRLRLLHNPRKLQSAGVNLAVQQLGGEREVLVRCDAHACYPAGFIESLLRSLADHQADAVVVPMDSVGDAPLQRAVAWVSDTLVGSGGSAHRGGKHSGFVDHGHHAAFRLASFRRAGGYDETFSHNEDAELDCRQRALGARIYLDSQVRIGYLPRSQLGALWRQYFNYGAGRARTLQKHPTSWRWRQLAVPMNLLGMAVATLVTPLAPWAAAWPLAYLAVLLATSVGLSLKHGSPVGLWCGVVALVMHQAWALGFLRGWLLKHESRWHLQPRADHPSKEATNP